MTRRAHRHGEGLAIDADLQRLLDRYIVFAVVVADLDVAGGHQPAAWRARAIA
jgi:hypothetical protein